MRPAPRRCLSRLASGRRDPYPARRRRDPARARLPRPPPRSASSWCSLSYRAGRPRRRLHLRDQPVVAIALGALVADEETTVTTVVGAAIVCAGVYLGALVRRSTSPARPRRC